MFFIITFLTLLFTTQAHAQFFETPKQTPLQITIPLPQSPDQEYAQTHAIFQANVQILSINMYNDEWKSTIAPFDIAVGWGPLSSRQSLDHLNFTQSNRFYYWDIPQNSLKKWTAPQIILHSTNIHVIPANKTIYNRLLTIRAGDTVTIKGYLADIVRPDGLIWLTSLRRDDTGPGACEILILTDMTAL